MEGLLSVPPERGTIIGRAIWKARYVVIGSVARTQQGQTNRMQSNRSSTAKELNKGSEGLFLSIYKSKEDTEPIQQHALSSIADCQLQLLAHRKQGPVLPTMVLSVLPDPPSDKARKRRSSRTAAFSMPRETGPTALLFRPGDELQNLQEWTRFIQQLIQPSHNLDRAPMSPLTPASPTFINPFAPRSRDPSDIQRPESRGACRPSFFTKNSSQSSSTRDRPVTFSDSPSLRSKRSDLSSQTSSVTQSYMGLHNYSNIFPSDLPSPATTVGEYQGELIEGWTSAQGRSSALSSPMRERNSISSQAPTSLSTIPDSNSSSGPRETILDRAFQLRCIPGSEREIPGEEKLSSLARFDALMREMDEKRKQREAEEAKLRPHAAAGSLARLSGSELKSAFDDDSDEGDDEDEDEEDEDSDIVEEGDLDDRFPPSRSAQRTLDLITGRFDTPQRNQYGSRYQVMRSPPTYNQEAFIALSNPASSQARPQTGYSNNRNRPGMAQRTHSQPHLATMMASSSTPLDTTQEAEDGLGFSFTPNSPSVVQRNSAEKRRSVSSAKRLSFTELTRRLSSTSSLLLMQSNASGPASSRASNSDMDFQNPPQSPPQHLHHLHPRAGPPAAQQHQPQQPASSISERCGWRGSVGVFGDGGFV